MTALAVTVLLLLLLSVHAFAAPKDPENYEKTVGGFADIRDGAYVEGSLRTGGVQPDYFIDLESEPLKGIIQKCEAIKGLNVDYWEKVGTVLGIVWNDVFKYTDYHSPFYRRLMKKYRLAGEDIPLSQYVACRSGVCREHALVLHFALKAAGIKNLHAYATIYRASRSEGYEITEDHAFNVVRKDGVDWVVDAYYWGFNGFRLKDLLSPEGITERSATVPIAEPGPGIRRIVRINGYPVIYNPSHNPKAMRDARCSAVFR